MLLYRKMSLTFCPDVPRNLQGKAHYEGHYCHSPTAGSLGSQEPHGTPTLTPTPHQLPDPIDGGLVGVGDQLQSGVGGSQGEHARVQGLLGECVVGRVKFTWHYVHGH